MKGYILPKCYRVLKWWRHKNEISEIMGFVRIFWKNNVQEVYLPKMSISRQIVSEIVAQLYSENSIQTLLIFFFGSTQKKPIKSKGKYKRDVSVGLKTVTWPISMKTRLVKSIRSIAYFYNRKTIHTKKKTVTKPMQIWKVKKGHVIF